MSQNELQRVVAEMRETAFHPDRSALEEMIWNWASRIEAAQAVAPGGGEVPREALEKLFRAFVRAGGVMTVARHGVDIDQDEFYRDVQHGVMEIERYLHPERFDEFPTGTAPGYGALARTKADQKWGEWSAVLRRLIGDRTEKLHFAAEVQAVGDGVRIDNCRFINKEPVGYISFGEYRESCDVTDDQRATWQPVWTSKPDAMLAAAPASEAKGPPIAEMEYEFRICEHCGCNTNASLRRCCDKGTNDDRTSLPAHPIDKAYSIRLRNEMAAASSAAGESEGQTSAAHDDFHGDGRDNKRQPQGTTSGSSPGYSRPPHHTDRFEFDEGDRMTLRCALVSFSEELKRDGLGTDDHGVKMTASYLARISRLLTRINNSAAECKTCNSLGIVGGVSGQTPESMEQVTENCPDCSDVVTAGGTSTSDDELPGMWSRSDFTGGATDAEQEQVGELRSMNFTADMWNPYEILRLARRSLDGAEPLVIERVDECIRQEPALLRRAARVEVTPELAYEIYRKLGEVMANHRHRVVCDRYMAEALTAALEPKE